ncbi:STM4015 family protein [Streptomyces sp. NPDC000594]|uniref:STM4015 family protein n=1 Tax=Streptomyces sp. NPDC000594 TaxID=3154261 RepID=UPI003316B3AD
MTVSNIEKLHGLPVFDFPAAGEPGDPSAFPPPATVAWRVSVPTYQDGDDDEKLEEAFARFLGAVDTSQVQALVIGGWLDAYEESPIPLIEALCAAAGKFPALRAIFLGDISAEECEISWITQGKVTPLLDAFPELREFAVRGGSSLEFPAVRHTGLRILRIEAGGLDAEVVRGVAASDLPALEELDLWLGTSWYGGTAEITDLEPILAGTRLPALRRLALRNSEIQDGIATAVAGAPVVARLETLDLSMGTLGNDGAEALLTGQPLTHLNTLDLHHHFLSRPMMERITETFAGTGVTVDLSEDERNTGWGESEDDRYTAVAE